MFCSRLFVRHKTLLICQQILVEFIRVFHISSKDKFHLTLKQNQKTRAESKVYFSIFSWSPSHKHVFYIIFSFSAKWRISVFQPMDHRIKTCVNVSHRIQFPQLAQSFRILSGFPFWRLSFLAATVFFKIQWGRWITSTVSITFKRDVL